MSDVSELISLDVYVLCALVTKLKKNYMIIILDIKEFVYFYDNLLRASLALSFPGYYGFIFKNYC